MDELLKNVACVLQFRSPEGLWHARLKGANSYGHGETLLEAIEAAQEDRKTPPRRRVVSDPAPRRRPTQGGFFD